MAKINNPNEGDSKDKPKSTTKRNSNSKTKTNKIGMKGELPFENNDSDLLKGITALNVNGEETKTTLDDYPTDVETKKGELENSDALPVSEGENYKDALYSDESEKKDSDALPVSEGEKYKDALDSDVSEKKDSNILPVYEGGNYKDALYSDVSEKKDSDALPVSEGENYKDTLDNDESEKKDSDVLPESEGEATNIDIISSDFRTNSFNLSGNLYIQVHKSNLLQYFSCGIIFPNKYSYQNAFSDPQSINENGIIISNGIISKDPDLTLIQIDPCGIDILLLSQSNEFGLYSGVIPISRIFKILVADKDTKQKILNDSTIREAGLIPDSLIEIGIPAGLAKVSYMEINHIPHEWDSKMRQFDKILGLIAGTRNFNVITYNQTGIYKTISDHSLFAIQAINKPFANEIVVGERISDYYRYLFTNSCPIDIPLFRWLFHRVYDDSNFTDNDTVLFDDLCSKNNSFAGEEEQVKLIFSNLKKSLKRKTVLLDIPKLKSKNSLALYVFAYLRNFGTSQSPEQARVELFKSEVTKFSEFAFAVLNFFFGYRKLRNSEDRIKINDDSQNSLLKSSIKPIIKFELTTEFDYRVIDTVFDLVFDIDLKKNSYSQYQNILADQIEAPHNIDGYKCVSAIINGKKYQSITKVDVVGEIIKQLNKLPNEIGIFSEFFGLCWRLELTLNSFSIVELIRNSKLLSKAFYYSKLDLINAVKMNKIDIEEIEQRIQLSQKYGEIQ
jgi:hypothetical protein